MLAGRTLPPEPAELHFPYSGKENPLGCFVMVMEVQRRKVGHVVDLSKGHGSQRPLRVFADRLKPYSSMSIPIGLGIQASAAENQHMLQLQPNMAQHLLICLPPTGTSGSHTRQGTAVDLDGSRWWSMARMICKTRPVSLWDSHSSHDPATDARMRARRVASITLTERARYGTARCDLYHYYDTRFANLHSPSYMDDMIYLPHA
ncbi:hypothetical protein CIHG_06698 [Coccidioides immitis H538.4]|uniref:Uncharacterized protein n=2 Tax=Coccidioides immitis TaxID=5501 RepID=A0A0J8RWE1_COCIT|nr:hypothetical protein CIRG_01590 [Coccidioides immitis RMSCC 2394]KMU88896.1 hypothetical protein CIHG_06698 [Coccidioides immitis H538.4]